MKRVMKEVPRKEYYVFSPFLRIFHWVMVVAIVVLFFTGLYIATPLVSTSLEPTYSAKVMDIVRDVHFTAAFLFLAAFILRVYGFVINRGDRLFPHFWKGHFYRDSVEVIMHYMFLKSSHKPFLRNPLARATYFVMYFVIGFEALTGFALFFGKNPDSIFSTLLGFVTILCGNEMNVHLVHHYIAWLIAIFAIGHVYLVFRTEFMEHEPEVSSMVNGYKILHEEPADAADIESDEERAEHHREGY